MRATACAVLLALVCAACAASAPSRAGHHGSKTASTQKRPVGVVRIHTSLVGGPQEPKTHRGVLDHKPVGNVRISVVRRDGRHWHGRTSDAGVRTFKLSPGRYVITSRWCGPRRSQIKVLPEREVPVRYACSVPSR